MNYAIAGSLLAASGMGEVEEFWEGTKVIKFVQQHALFIMEKCLRKQVEKNGVR